MNIEVGPKIQMEARGQTGMAASQLLRRRFGSKHDVISKPVEAPD
jgi:hypothetical protein